MNKSDELFNSLNIDLNAIVEVNAKYFPVSFFDSPTMENLTLDIPGNTNGNYKMLPMKIWEIWNIRNGYQDKSPYQDITFAEAVSEPLGSEISSSFIFYHYGDGICVRRSSSPFKLSLNYYKINRTYLTMKELPKLEFKNILFCLKTKNGSELFEGMKRFKNLFQNTQAENTIKPETVLQNQSITGFYL
jgi:hypothetical protein